MGRYNTAVGVSTRSGLSVDICMTMLNQGWVYIEEVDKPSRWEKQF